MSNQNQSTESQSPLLPFIIITLAGTFYVYEFFLRVMPSAMTTELMRAFDMEASGLGILSALFFYGYAPMQIPAGLLIDRLGPRVLLTGSVLVCSLGALIFGLTDNFVIAAIGRTLIGLSSAFAFIGSLVLASRWFDAKYFALIAGLIQFMGCLGAIAGVAPIAAIVKEFGWRPTQIWSAVGGLILSVLFWLFIRDNPPEAINVAKYKGALIEDESEMARIRHVVKNKQTWAIATYAFSCWAPVTIFAVLWGVPFLKELYHTSTAVAAKGISIVWIGIAVFSPIIGWWSNRINNRRIPLLTCAIVSLVTSLSIIYVDNLSWTLVSVLLFFYGAAAGAQAVTFGVVQDNMPPNVAGTAVGFNNMAVIAGGVLFQPLVGLLLDAHWSGNMLNGLPNYTLHNYRMALIIIPICGVIGIISSLFMMKETHCQAQFELKIPPS